MIRRIASFLLPKNSRRRAFVRRILVKLGLAPPVVGGYYNTLYQQAHQHISQVRKIDKTGTWPLISVVVPAYNTKQRYIDELVYSVMAQTYTNWELVLVDASTDDQCRAVIKKLAERDARIRLIPVENKGISGNTNSGIQEAAGDYVAFCDHDDLLDPSALQEVALAIHKQNADVVYTDEDKVTDNSEIYYDPHFKPNWSPDQFTHVNYLNHLTAIKKELLLEVGLLNSEYDGAQDYELLLRVIDKDPKIVHVPKVLYHWRAADGSTARDFTLKSHITDAASAALQGHFKRQGVKVTVTPRVNKPGFYALNFEQYKTAAIIVTPFAADAVLRLYNEILVKRTNITCPTQLIVPEGTAPRFNTDNLTVISLPVSDDYMKQALHRVDSDTVVCIGTIAFPEHKEWLQPYSAALRLEHVGAVSPMLLIDGDIIDECGLIRHDGNYLPLFNNQIATNNQTYFGNTDWVRDVDALTGSVVAVRTKDFLQYINANPALTYVEAVRGYSIEGKYNMVYTDVRFNRQGIRFPRTEHNAEFFNSNLDPYGDGYTMYMPESAAVNVMMHIAESEGIDL